MKHSNLQHQNSDRRIYLPVITVAEANTAPTPTPTPTQTPPATPTPMPPATPTPRPVPLTRAEAARFLAQAAWGAAPDDLDALVATGYAGWIDAQRAVPVSKTRPYLDAIQADIETNATPAASAPYFRNDAVPHALTPNFATAWMRNIVFGTDQLRQRMAWIWSQIMVVSFNGVGRLQQNGRGMAGYYDTLATHALGNFRDLLRAVTLHPVMAYFLSSLGNEKANPANNQYPDENYAREVMQLFTIGLWELDAFGEQRRNAAGEPIPTYDNADIEEFARVFTGLWFGGRAFPADGVNWPARWISDYTLSMFESRHDNGAKTLFHGKPWQRVLPAGQAGLKDIDDAIDALVSHPNTAPFIAKALIKFMVTSNPSKDFVKRIADVFADNGAGARGDLFAVTRAILLDHEARGLEPRENPRHGKLQEPLLRTAGMVRAFQAGKSTPELQFWGLGKQIQLNQWPLYSPSVFNFFMPGYRHLGTLARNGLTSPEFQILNSVSIATNSNQFAQWIDSLLHTRLAGGTPEFKFDFSAELALANTPDALLDRLDLLLCRGTMSAETRERVLAGINGAPASAPDNRVRIGVFLAAVCPEAAVLR
jgi:uncharacterized protein (DUF1800 family)